MNASTVEAIADKMETLEAQVALLDATLRDVKQLARSALVGTPIPATVDLDAIREHIRVERSFTHPNALAGDAEALMNRLASLEALHEHAAVLNSISTRIASAQQALRVTDDAEHKRGHEKDDAALTAWAASLGGAEHLEPAARLRYFAARKRLNARLTEQDGGGTDAGAVSTLHAGVGPVTTTRNADRPPTSHSQE